MLLCGLKSSWIRCDVGEVWEKKPQLLVESMNIIHRIGSILILSTTTNAHQIPYTARFSFIYFVSTTTYKNMKNQQLFYSSWEKCGKNALRW